MPNSNPGFITSQVPSAANWNSYFTGKVDASGGIMTGGTINSTIIGGTTPAAASFTTANVTTQDGFQVAGDVLMRIGKVISSDGSTSQTQFFGKNAGAAYNLASTTDLYSSVGIGTGALQSLTSIQAENVAVGAWSSQYVTTGGLITSVGMHANGSNTVAPGITAIGNDTLRDAIVISGGGYVTAVGQAAVAHGAPGDGVVGVGSQALRGNSAVVILGGTKTTGNTITIGATSATSGLVGTPLSKTYTVLSGDTMATIAAGVAALVNASVTGPSYFLECVVNGPLPDGTYALSMNFPGTTTTGWALAFTATTSGGATCTVAVVGGSSPTQAVAIGNDAAVGTAMGALSNLTAVGHHAGLSLTTGSFNTLIGSSAGGSLMTGHDNAVVGEDSFWVATTANGCVVLGTTAAMNVTTSTDLTIVGGQAGNAVTTANFSTLIGHGAGATFATGNGVILIGSGIFAVDTPLASTSNYINIENIITVTGTGTPSTSVTDVAGALTAKSIDNLLFADQFASIQAAIDALPSTGGMVVLPPATTYTLTTGVSSSKPNVHLWAPSWGTVIKRGAALGGDLCLLNGAGSIIEGMTFDGNGAVNITGNSEVGIGYAAANCLIRNVQVINSSSAMNIQLTGEGSRVTGCTIIGRGVALSTQRGYGIWAINHNQVSIDNNVVSGTGIDGIGVDGDGSLVIGNHVFSCHWWGSDAGGQITIYPNYSDILVANNTVIGGGGANSIGLELAGTNLTVVGNTVSNTHGSGIVVDTWTGIGLLISGNTIRNSGQVTVISSGIAVQTTIVGMSIVGNRVIDDQTTATQQYAVNIPAGATNKLLIEGNDFLNNLLGPVLNGATGSNQVISNNLGIDATLGTIASAATLTLGMNPVISLTGSVGVGTIAGPLWTGRAGKFIPTGAVVFTAGATIGNTVTCAAGVPIGFTFDGTKLYLG